MYFLLLLMIINGSKTYTHNTHINIINIYIQYT